VQKTFKRSAVLGLAGALLAFAGTTSAKDITLAFVADNMQYPYDVSVAKGFQDAAKELGAKTLILDPKGSVEKQGNAIDDLITQKVEGIAAILVDSVVAKTWVDRSAENNIPFVASAVQVGDPAKVPVRQVYSKLTALVTTDDTLSGELAGELAATLLPKGREAKIGIIEGAPGFAVVRQRTEGFEAGLAKKGVKYKIVASQPTDWTPEKGEAVCQNLLTAHADIDLIFSQADDMALGCARAIHAAGAKTKLVATGGGSKLGNDAIKNGEMDGSVCTKPETIGRLSAKALYDAATKKDTQKAKFVSYDMPTVTKASLAKCPPEW